MNNQAKAVVFTLTVRMPKAQVSPRRGKRTTDAVSIALDTCMQNSILLSNTHPHYDEYYFAVFLEVSLYSRFLLNCRFFVLKSATRAIIKNTTFVCDN